jgi:hypothetical protein
MENCIINIRSDTKKRLSDFKASNEDSILDFFKKKRRFVSWDDAINYALEKKANR